MLDAADFPQAGRLFEQGLIFAKECLLNPTIAILRIERLILKV